VCKVEDPYLLGVHGSDYMSYTVQSGRLVPGVGLHPTGDPEGGRRESREPMISNGRVAR